MMVAQISRVSFEEMEARLEEYVDRLQVGERVRYDNRLLMAALRAISPAAQRGGFPGAVEYEPL